MAVSACGAPNVEPGVTRKALSETQNIAADVLQTELALSPELANRLDLERFGDEATRFRLDNHSQAGFERARLIRIELLQRLRSRPVLPASHRHTRDLSIAETALTDLIELEQYGHGRFAYDRLRPYSIDPFSGIWIEGPAILAYRQPVNTAEDANAYIARLQGLSDSIEDTARRLQGDAASDTLPPRPLLAETIARLERLITLHPDTLDTLHTTYAGLTSDLDDLEEAERNRLVQLAEDEVTEVLKPAYSSLSETLVTLTEDAPEQVALRAQPNGFDLYAQILKTLSGVSLPTELMHQRNLDEVSARRQSLEQRLVFPEDTLVPERLEQRLALFAALQTLIVSSEPSAPAGPPPLTFGRVSAWDSISTGDNPEHMSIALAAYLDHLRGEPYARWTADAAREQMPMRQLFPYPAIQSGWRLYAWDQSPQNTTTEPESEFGEVSALHVGLLQAAFGAVDTGLHLERWSLAEATDYLAVNTGLAEPVALQVALNIAANPGFHATSMATYRRIEDLSERAKAVLGSLYDEVGFQSALIRPGPRPLDMIEQDIEAWYAARLPQNQDTSD